MRVVGYTRVSTREQARDGLSLFVQREKLELYCKLHGHELVDVIEDPGESAKSLDRPGLDRVQAMLRGRQVDGLLIAKLDRLTRRLRDWSDLVDEHFSEKKGARLMSIQDHINTDTASGRMMLNLLMTVAQWEIEVISERTTEELTYKRQNNERCGSVRYGFDLDVNGPRHPESGLPTRLVRNECEQDVIATMIEGRQAGLSYRAIARNLEAAGIPTKKGGTTWHPETVKSILTWSVEAA